MNIDEIYKIIKAFETGNIKELEVEKEGTRLRLVKPDQFVPATAGSMPAPAYSAQAQGALASRSAEAAGKPGADATGEAGVFYQKSPIVGTFYRAPAPGAEPFVDVGDRVKKGQILCIVEAMKLMNEIEAEVSGEIVQVFLENAQPVEYGEVLFGIRTT